MRDVKSAQSFKSRTDKKQIKTAGAKSTCRLFIRTHALGDTDALEYISKTGKYLDANVEVQYEGE